MPLQETVRKSPVLTDGKTEGSQPMGGLRGLLMIGGMACGATGIAMMLDKCDAELVAGSNLLVVAAVLLSTVYIQSMIQGGRGSS
jgi:hypothetical protein